MQIDLDECERRTQMLNALFSMKYCGICFRRENDLVCDSDCDEGDRFRRREIEEKRFRSKKNKNAAECFVADDHKKTG